MPHVSSSGERRENAAARTDGIVANEYDRWAGPPGDRAGGGSLGVRVRIERLGSDIRIRSGGPIDVCIRPPGSKSLTNRHLLMAALADGESTLVGASGGDDAFRMIDGLRRLGFAVEVTEDMSLIRVSGCAGQLPADEAAIDAGPAGTAMRFLTALCTLGRGAFRIDGSARMRKRPIGPLVDGLTALGAAIGYDDIPGYPPLTIMARGLDGGTADFRDPPSSQFLSALLMVAPYAREDVFLRIDGAIPSRPYLDLTLDAMATRGVDVLTVDGSRFVVAAGQRYAGGEVEIEPDASAATYWWAAAAVTGGRAVVEGVRRGSHQGDARFVDVLAAMGCAIEDDDRGLAVLGPANGRLRGVTLDLNEMPDTVQTLAAVALFAEGPTTISNVANLRIKETDRLAALEAELTKFGAEVELRPDGLTIHPPRHVTPATVETYDDHRMALSFAVVGLRIDGVIIREAGCVAKSYPTFFDELERV